MSITAQPVCVKTVGTSTEVSPVTQTELVAIKKESIHEIPPPFVQCGIFSRMPPTKMIKRKLIPIINDGFVRFPINLIILLEINKSENNDNTAKW